MKLVRYIEEHTTVTDFAKKIGKSRMQVHRYLNGRNLTKRAIEEIVAATDGLVQPIDFFEPVQPKHDQVAQ